MNKRIFINSAVIGLALIMSGGIVFAATGHYVRALLSTGKLTANGRSASIPELYYNGAHYYPFSAAFRLLNYAKISGAQSYGNLRISSPFSSSDINVSIGGNSLGNVSEILNQGVPYVNANVLFNAFNKVGINASISNRSVNISLPVDLAVYPPTKVVSLFDYPHFALGNSNAAGSTTIYNNFSDNLGNNYTLPTLSWNVSAPAATTTSTTTASTTTAPKYLPFYPTTGTSGTFSEIYNLYGKYKGFSALLVPSAYFNNTTINSNTGSLEIDRGNGTALFTSGNVSSGNLSPTHVYVSLYGVKQIQVTFTSNGLGMVDPVLIKR